MTPTARPCREAHHDARNAPNLQPTAKKVGGKLRPRPIVDERTTATPPNKRNGSTLRHHTARTGNRNRPNKRNTITDKSRNNTTHPEQLEKMQDKTAQTGNTSSAPPTYQDAPHRERGCRYTGNQGAGVPCTGTRGQGCRDAQGSREPGCPGGRKGGAGAMSRIHGQQGPTQRPRTPPGHDAARIPRLPNRPAQATGTASGMPRKCPDSHPIRAPRCNPNSNAFACAPPVSV